MMLKFWMICHEICEKIAAAFSLLRAGALSCGRALSSRWDWRRQCNDASDKAPHIVDEYRPGNAPASRLRGLDAASFAAAVRKGRAGAARAVFSSI